MKCLGSIRYSLDEYKTLTKTYNQTADIHIYIYIGMDIVNQYAPMGTIGIKIMALMFIII